MDERTLLIRDRLIEKANELLASFPTTSQFSGNDNADRMLNDLEHYPHAYVIACIMDRQIPFERAWLIPYEVGQRLGSFQFDFLASQPPEVFDSAMSIPTPLHRFPATMGKAMYLAIQRIEDVYSGNASKIWSGKPSSGVVVQRFLEFHGAGPKIANMAANILHREMGVQFSDYRAIDISVDVHTRRAAYRLGLVPDGAADMEIIFAARQLNPEYPGILDLPLWYLGRDICRPLEPFCKSCYVADLCSDLAKNGYG
jgi:endonuclease III